MGPGSKMCSLNENYSHWLMGSGTIRRDGLVGGSLSLWGVGFEVSYAQGILSVTYNSLPISCRSIHRSQVLLQKYHVYLPTWFHYNNGLILCNCRPEAIKHLLLQELLWSLSLHSNRNPNSDSHIIIFSWNMKSRLSSSKKSTKK